MVLVVDEAQLAQEPRMAPFWVAHEVGHIALGHVRRRRFYTVMLLLFLPLLVGPFIVAFAGGGPAHLGLASAAGVLTWPFTLRWQVRPGEAAADQFAARVGCPLDSAALAAYLKGHGWIDENAGAWLGSHPDWATRLRIAQQNTPASGET